MPREAGQFSLKDAKSPKNNIKIYTHTFYTNHLGEPAGFKSTSKIRTVEVRKKWNELQELGWT